MTNESELYVIRPRENSISKLSCYENIVEGVSFFLYDIRLNIVLLGVEYRV